MCCRRPHRLLPGDRRHARGARGRERERGRCACARARRARRPQSTASSAAASSNGLTARRALRSAAPVVHRCHASPVVVPVLVGAPVIIGQRAGGAARRGEARERDKDVGAPRSSHLFRGVDSASAPWCRAPWRRNGAASFTACPVCPVDSPRCHLATRHRQVQVLALLPSPRRSAEVESESLRASQCASRRATPPAWSTRTLHSTR